MTFIINQIIFIVINLLMAKRDFNKIKKDIPVDHFENGIVYYSFVTILAVLFRMNWYEIVLFSFGCASNRQLFFDIPLNIWRKLKWDYVSPNPESFFDKQEKKIFGDNGKLPSIIYLAIFSVTIFITLIIEK